MRTESFSDIRISWCWLMEFNLMNFQSKMVVILLGSWGLTAQAPVAGASLPLAE